MAVGEGLKNCRVVITSYTNELCSIFFLLFIMRTIAASIATDLSSYTISIIYLKNY